MLKCTHMEVVCSIFAGALFLACWFCIILLRPIERANFQNPWPFRVILLGNLNFGIILFKPSPTIWNQSLLCTTLPCMILGEICFFSCQILLSRCMYLSFSIPGHMFYYSAASCMLSSCCCLFPWHNSLPHHAQFSGYLSLNGCLVRENI